jgi:hypothetical protein
MSAMSEGGDQDIDSQCLSKVHVLKGRRGGCGGWSPATAMVNDVVDVEADGTTLLMLMMLPPPRKLLARDEKLLLN